MSLPGPSLMSSYMPVHPPPQAQAIIRHKWVTFAKTFLVFNIACFLLWLSAFTGLMMVYSVRERGTGL